MFFKPGRNTSKTFTADDTVSYLLTYNGPETVTEDSFNYFSHPDGSKGPFLVAAHVQNTATGGSAWLAAETISPTVVPEPSSAALLSLLGFSLMGRRVLSRHRA